MPLNSAQLDAAKKVAKESKDAAEFRTKANATDVPWWRAQADVAKIQAETDKPDVKAFIKAFCRKVPFSSGATYIAEKVAPADNKGRTFWLKYFLMECNMIGGSTLPAEQVEDVINTLLSFKDEKKGDLEIRYGSFDNIPADKMRGLMTKLLTWGFDKIPGNAVDLQAGDSTVHQLSDYMRQITGEERYQYAWRSDSRAFADIVDSEGFMAKGRSEKYAQAFGMRAPWHPYSDPNVRKYMWFRKGQRDNCLYSIVSIAKTEENADWRAYLPFPLLKDAPWGVSDKQVMCRVDGKWVTLKLGVSTTWLYLFVMSDLLVLDTGKLQGHEAFPEQGAAGIPLENIYGAIRFVRIYHAPAGDNPTAEKGAELDAVGLSALPVEAVYGAKHKYAMAMRWGEERRNKVAAVFDAAAHSGPVHVGWKPTGFAELKPAFDLGGKKVELSMLSFKELR